MSVSKFFEIEDTGFNYDKERTRIIQNLDMLKTMEVMEFTLYKKWEECRSLKERMDSAVNTMYRIWKPKNIADKDETISEVARLKPVLKLVESEKDNIDWTNLRIFVSSHTYEQTPGRMLKFLVLDEVSGKYLGIISLSSDVVKIGARDDYIGWNDTDKFDNGKLKHTCIGSCIVPTQPFGYNFLGGKLMAALLSTQYIRDVWKREYGNTLVGMTTTSLYGINSMYNGIPYWKTLGESAGKIFIKPDDEFYETWHHWLKENKPIEYEKATTQKEGVAGPPTGVKQKILSMIFNQLNIQSTKYFHGFQRGVFFAPFYENTKEFLTSKIGENELVIKPKLKDDIGGVIKWWSDKAIKRYEKLHSESRLKPEVLYYNKLPFLSWDETKKLYLENVGR